MNWELFVENDQSFLGESGWEENVKGNIRGSRRSCWEDEGAARAEHVFTWVTRMERADLSEREVRVDAWRPPRLSPQRSHPPLIQNNYFVQKKGFSLISSTKQRRRLEPNSTGLRNINPGKNGKPTRYVFYREYEMNFRSALNLTLNTGNP